MQPQKKSCQIKIIGKKTSKDVTKLLQFYTNINREGK